MELDKEFQYADEATWRAFENQRVAFRRANDFDRYQVGIVGLDCGLWLLVRSTVTSMLVSFLSGL